MKAFINFFFYCFHVLFYILFGLADRELFEWEESFFYSRPTSDDFETNALLQGWNLDEEGELD